TLNNCTLTANSASSAGGGAAYATLNNCICYYNTAPSGSNYTGGTLTYCCTTPLPTGTGNFTYEPLFIDNVGGNLRLQSNSPCINAGNNAYITNNTDLDGNPRLVGAYVDLGAYEYQFPAPTPALPSLQATYTNVATGFVVVFTGQIAGYPNASRWDFADGTVI